MADTDGVLAAIDSCLDDYDLSEDAMRWAPDEPDPTPEDGLGLWGQFINGDQLYRTTSPPYEFVVRHGEPLADLAVSLHADVTAFAEGMRRAAGAVAEAFGKAFIPMLTATQRAFHKLAYQGDRKHFRRCSTCNPAGFPTGMSIDRGEYRRRRR
ncbi:hypothetical protein ACFXJ8_26110 [Nonomuraea sp. NPDC059194]|uniref:hypothetical protein n=1 Tax=Nonomuraea sp. NPDC059194 TaxID=3346764 RepID=UPI0036A258AF